MPALPPASELVTLSVREVPNIAPKAIIWIVLAGIVPVFIAFGVVIWLLGFYGRDRSCYFQCHRSRKKHSTNATNLHPIIDITLRDLPSRAESAASKDSKQSSTTTLHSQDETWTQQQQLRVFV
ncbi:hypothetical protein B0J11DRAFT_505035 [Dendryphion nanum]|uniref:Uncharacterized protein n=1 Tax=Dendryphion nanum TaxID=256645 RepID=A0A9P9IN21_9PLEO|nr:hypothetical protein B0J11DRAFT_505035 [Dendryphion nanum]